MKISFAIACLLGITSAQDNAWALTSVSETAADAKDVNSYVQYATVQSNKEVKDSTHLQVYDNLSSDSD